jgi:hypothetical protein
MWIWWIYAQSGGFSTLLARSRIKVLGFYEDFLPQLNAMKARRIERFYNG